MANFNWERTAVTLRLRADARAEATRRRYDAALKTRRNLAALIARRNLSHRTACLCPDHRRQHDDTPCPHLPPR